jgi:outer membrane phospholipase A
MPNQAVTAGAQASVEFAILNRSASEQVFTPPASLPAKLTSGAKTWTIELHASSTAPNLPRPVPPGGFATITYRLALPAGSSGIAIIEALPAGFTPVRGVIEILAADSALPARPAPAQPAERTEKPVTNLARAEPAASIIQRTFANRLAPHESIYFVYGPDAPAAKFQFSFKYRLLNFTELSRKRMSRTLQFGFTQRSLWDMEAVSSPFYDTSYMPELIFESLAAQPEEGDHSFTWLGYQAAFKHESNGRDGPVSRSLNTVYFRPAFAFGKLDGWHLLVLPELFAYITSLENNPDLKAYRGYGQLRLVLGRNDGPTLLASLWAGRKLEHQSIQLDLTLPIRTRLLNFETYALIQYFNGYGESLLSYQAKSETIRAGFSLVR